MTFFNKKEDVLEIELTQFGKYRLSQGELSPVYYAFFDDDIIYDARYGGVNGEAGNNQNLIAPRIKEMPTTRVQHSYTGAETEVTRNIRLMRLGEIIDDGKAVFVGKKDPNLKIFKPTNDRNFSSYAPLGHSDLFSEKAPAWRLTFYNGRIESSVTHLSSAVNAAAMAIPQIETTVKYTTSIGPISETPFAGEDAKEVDLLYGSDQNFVGLEAERFDFDDDTYIEMTKRYLLLKVEELNSPFTNDNFDIEIFELTSSVDLAGNQVQEWVPTYFPADASRWGGDVPTNIQTLLTFPDIDSTYSEYFFETNVDDEILEEEICPAIVEDKNKDHNIYDHAYRCPDLSVLRASQEIGATAIENVFNNEDPLNPELSGDVEIEECE